ncbi:unnamed protein product, partial [Nesidiocoris tenuis]
MRDGGKLHFFYIRLAHYLRKGYTYSLQFMNKNIPTINSRRNHEMGIPLSNFQQYLAFSLTKGPSGAFERKLGPTLLSPSQRKRSKSRSIPRLLSQNLAPVTRVDPSTFHIPWLSQSKCHQEFAQIRKWCIEILNESTAIDQKSLARRSTKVPDGLRRNKNLKMSHTGEGQSTAGTSAAVQSKSVNFIPPPFWKANVPIWFGQVEAQFRMKGINDDDDRFDCVIGAIDSSVLAQVGDLITNPPALNKYDTLKTRLIGCFSDSEEKKLQKLLQETKLGDQRPSHLLREMRELANNRVSEEILKTLWLQRLPANVQGILSVSADPNLATLAILADKILEVCDPRNSVCVVNNELPIRNRSRSPNADIADRIEALTRRFDEFESRYSSRLPRPRDRSRTRSKSPRRLSRSARQKVDDGSWLCRYHFRFVPWSLMVDASDTAIGGSVQQLVNGSWQPLGFYSRKLSENERKYSAYDQEEPTGSLKFGDKCERTSDCGFRGAVCDESLKTCQCKPELTATNHIDKCGPEGYKMPTRLSKGGFTLPAIWGEAERCDDLRLRAEKTTGGRVFEGDGACVFERHECYRKWDRRASQMAPTKRKTW